MALFCILYSVLCVPAAQAGSPTGNDWFQVLASPFTGGDNTGDGGTGLPADLNYYYVGQAFVGTMQINVDTVAGSNAANIWIEYPTTTISASALTNGTFYPTWSGQVVSSTIGRVYSTGFQTTGFATGLGSFGTVTWTMLRPTVAAYGTGAPAILDINIGTVGNTTESNISNNGVDILDDEEDFSLHVWADTKKPYALNPVPANAAAAVAIDANYTFDLRDSKNGEGDNTGVGTGVNTTEPPGAITTDDGGGAVSVVAYDAFSCSGIWGTNLCGVTVNPPSPSGIVGDTRNWKYATTYTVNISGFQDLASASQNQLGDTNGPNTMDPKSFTFTTEADTVDPQVTAETPVRSSTGNSPSTNLIIDVQDRKTYPSGPSGTGVATSTCRFDVGSPSVATTTYMQGSAGVTVASIDYGVRFTIDPATDFAQNETVTVSAYNCADLAGNVMTTDNWSFATADSAPPYVTGESPSNDQTATLSQNVTFHIKDDGVGVSLANTVIFFDGIYYTNAGGAGSVTTVGTKITFTTSSNFNGGNYVGDTTAVSGTVNDYTFLLDPQNDYDAGEAVPVIIYTRDASGNLMERVVYSFVATGVASVCPAGSTFCGAGTTWNGSHCVASGGGSCSSSGGGGLASVPLEINEPTVSVTQIDETSVLVTWATNIPAGTVVVYDTVSPVDGTPPRYGYRIATAEANVTSTYHSMQIRGLQPGIIYFFRPVSRWFDQYARGIERLMMTRTPNQAAGITPISPPPAPVASAPFLCPAPAIISNTVTSTITNTSTVFVPVPGETVTVEKPTTLWLERARSTLPPSVGYVLLGLATLLALSALLLLRLRDPRYAVPAALLAVVMIGTAILGIWLLREPLKEVGIDPMRQGKQIDIRGGVISPFGGVPVSGIDLTVGDTSIHTSMGGQFAFPNAHVGEIMRINHSSLNRPMYWRVSDPGATMALLFDASLFNRLPESVTVVTGIMMNQRDQTATVSVEEDAMLGSYTFVNKNGVWTLVE